MTCLDIALIGLKLIGITLQTIPAIAVTNEYGLGAYAIKAHVIYISDVNNCRVLIHELIHDAQEEARPGQFTEALRWAYERDAVFKTLLVERALRSAGYPLTPAGALDCGLACDGMTRRGDG